MRIVADKRITENLAITLAKKALSGDCTPQRYLIEVNKTENTVLIAKKSESAMEGNIFPLNFRYHVVMSDVL